MDITKLFESAGNVEMPEEMQARIIKNCRDIRLRGSLPGRKFALITAALLLLLCITATGVGSRGFFRDIKDGFGAITGTEYLNATEEIDVQALLSDGILTVHIKFFTPDALPFRDCEGLGIGSYRITDADGNSLYEGTGTDPVPIADGRAEISIALDRDLTAPHAIIIDTFISTKKADQPLEITGCWEVQI